MAKNTIHILCPNGHRRKAQISDNSSLFQILDDVCHEQNLDSSEWGLIHQRQKVDLTIPCRLLNIPNNAVLEMFKMDDRRTNKEIHVQLQLPDGSRFPGFFEADVNFQQMLDFYRFQPESVIAALEISMSGTRDLCPVCSYLREEIIGDYALSNTTFRDLGLTTGTAIIRYDIRSVSDDQLRKINSRVDEKVFRSTTKPEKKQSSPKVVEPVSVPKPSKTNERSPKVVEPVSVPKPSKTNERSPKVVDPISVPKPEKSNERSSKVVNPISVPKPEKTNERSSKVVDPISVPKPEKTNESSTIFRDPPVSSASNSTTNKSQTKTLADELGINFSLEPEPPTKEQSRIRDEFHRFQFSPATKGKDLISALNESENSRRNYEKPCDRNPVFYDVSQTDSTKKNVKTSTEDSEQFYEVTSEDLRSILKTLKNESSNEIPLQTQSMREKTNGSGPKVYRRAAIRFVINSRYIVQALFRPEEAISSLFDFVRKYLICSNLNDKEFYLYLSQPRTVLDDLSKTLNDYDLVPAAFIYLGHQKISLLKVEISSKIQKMTLNEANRIVSEEVYQSVKDEKLTRQNSIVTPRLNSASSQSLRPMTPRKPSSNNVDDPNLREKLKRFLPTRK